MDQRITDSLSAPLNATTNNREVTDSVIFTKSGTVSNTLLVQPHQVVMEANLANSNTKTRYTLRGNGQTYFEQGSLFGSFGFNVTTDADGETPDGIELATYCKRFTVYDASYSRLRLDSNSITWYETSSGVVQAKIGFDTDAGVFYFQNVNIVEPQNDAEIANKLYVDNAVNPLYDQFDTVNNNANNAATLAGNALKTAKKNIYSSTITTPATGGSYNLTSTTNLTIEPKLGFLQNDRVRIGGYNGSVDATITSYNPFTGEAVFKCDSTGALPADGCYVTLLAAGQMLSGYAIASASRSISRSDSLLTAISILDRRSTDTNTTQKGFTNTSLRNSVTGGTFTNGELQGSPPPGSVPGMKFCDATYRYEFMNGMNDTDGTSYAWVRTSKV